MDWIAVQLNVRLLGNLIHISNISVSACRDKYNRKYKNALYAVVIYVYIGYEVMCIFCSILMYILSFKEGLTGCLSHN